MEEDDNVEEVADTGESPEEPSEETVENPEAAPDEESPEPEDPEEVAAEGEPEAEGEAPGDEEALEPEENADAEENANPEDVELEIRDEDEGRPVSSLSKKVKIIPHLQCTQWTSWEEILKSFAQQINFFFYEKKLNMAINLCIKVHIILQVISY